MEERRFTTDTANRDESRRKKLLGWLWLLLGLLLLGLLGYWLLNNNKDDVNNSANSTQTETTQNESANTETSATTSFAQLQERFNSQFTTDSRKVFFQPDTAEYQDEVSATSKLVAIAEFAKSNPEVKLQANGSIFEDDQIDATSQLAKERAERVKAYLVEQGVSADAITVSTLDDYEGTDEASRAMHARSVTLTVVE